jgi:hypothetical protein
MQNSTDQFPLEQILRRIEWKLNIIGELAMFGVALYVAWKVAGDVPADWKLWAWFGTFGLSWWMLFFSFHGFFRR